MLLSGPAAALVLHVIVRKFSTAECDCALSTADRLSRVASDSSHLMSVQAPSASRMVQSRMQPPQPRRPSGGSASFSRLSGAGSSGREGSFLWPLEALGLAYDWAKPWLSAVLLCVGHWLELALCHVSASLAVRVVCLPIGGFYFRALLARVDQEASDAGRDKSDAGYRIRFVKDLRPVI